jgi:hypothetical protein
MNGEWTLKRERDTQGATLLDDSDRFYLEIDGKRRYGYNTHLTGAYVCYTCGHVCECGEED